eukprot:TRINITY_DN4607_c0_g1_i1.p1 TRINITY_DN4607_c0_g1~~TRINITY_DN4607_c0_g1_i1.p1  ORF type:complete len:282 (+),score=87.98 TRINITY_DN4607_c0_g1_i1:94-846(+)
MQNVGQCFDDSDDFENPFGLLEQEHDSFIPFEKQTAVETESNVLVQEVAFSTVSVKTHIDPRQGCGGHLWTAAVVVVEYLIEHPELTKNKVVIELGAGTGVVGIAASKLGAKTVYLTDLPVMLDITRENVELNSADLRSQVVPMVYSWGTEWDLADGQKEYPDVIIASECVYLEGAYEPLLKSLNILAPDVNTTILIAYQHRRKAEKRFFTKLRRNFEIKRVEVENLSEDLRKLDVILLEAKRRPSTKII